MIQLVAFKKLQRIVQTNSVDSARNSRDYLLISPDEISVTFRSKSIGDFKFYVTETERNRKRRVGRAHFSRKLSMKTHALHETRCARTNYCNNRVAMTGGAPSHVTEDPFLPR